MFKKLQQRWNVNTTDMLLIICTFALGGSLCGYLGRQLLSLTNLGKGFAWVLLYILIITLLWPFCVLLISIFLGQFSFFKNYLKKIWATISAKKTQPVCVAIFASGTGTNAGKIIQKFNLGDVNDKRPQSEASNSRRQTAKICLVVCNKPGAGVLQVADDAKVKTLIIEKEQFFRGDHYLPEIKKHQIDFIILAGFLWKIPAALIEAYPGRIVNIHPALLPRHGGKGMYGSKVHEAVLAAGDKETGITIHYVDELYDHGNVIFQASCEVTNDDTPETLAAKVHLLEHQHYPRVLEQLLQNVK